MDCTRVTLRSLLLGLALSSRFVTAVELGSKQQLSAQSETPDLLAEDPNHPPKLLRVASGPEKVERSAEADIASSEVALETAPHLRHSSLKERRLGKDDDIFIKSPFSLITKIIDSIERDMKKKKSGKGGKGMMMGKGMGKGKGGLKDLEKALKKLKKEFNKNPNSKKTSKALQDFGEEATDLLRKGTITQDQFDEIKDALEAATGIIPLEMQAAPTFLLIDSVNVKKVRKSLTKALKDIIKQFNKNPTSQEAADALAEFGAKVVDLLLSGRLSQKFYDSAAQSSLYGFTGESPLETQALTSLILAVDSSEDGGAEGAFLTFLNSFLQAFENDPDSTVDEEVIAGLFSIVQELAGNGDISSNLASDIADTFEAAGLSTTTTPSSNPTVSAAPSSSPSLSAAPTESSMPSSNPTVSAAPSSNPTLSAAPSSNPTSSAAPSSNPTSSAAPSDAPSSNPTSSAAPSAAPSSSPSLSAAPSSNPTSSAAPSAAPSSNPSLSAVPSAAPSNGPSLSAAPSSGPSESVAPSVAPSSNPSSSAAPSAPKVSSKDE